MQSKENKEASVKKLLSHTETYELIVRFRRSLHDDLDVIEETQEGKNLVEDLLQQFKYELQSAYDRGLIAGRFEIIAGPLVSLSK